MTPPITNRGLNAMPNREAKTQTAKQITVGAAIILRMECRAGMCLPVWEVILVSYLTSSSEIWRCRRGPGDRTMAFFPCRGILDDRYDEPHIKFIGWERFHEPLGRALAQVDRGTQKFKTCSWYRPWLQVYLSCVPGWETAIATTRVLPTPTPTPQPLRRRRQIRHA